MLQTLYDGLYQIPLIFWLLMPAFLLGSLTYLITRKLKESAAIGALALFTAVLTAGFHTWERYLNNHVIASFDQSGLPTGFSRTGWGLALDAWPLWIMPVLLTLVLLLVGLLLYYVLLPAATNANNQQATAPKSQSKNYVSAQLELQKVKQKLKIADEKFYRLKEQQTNPAINTERYTQTIKKLREELTKIQKEKQVLSETTTIQTTDLERANTLIDRLLSEKFGDEK